MVQTTSRIVASVAAGAAATVVALASPAQAGSIQAGSVQAGPAPISTAVGDIIRVSQTRSGDAPPGPFPLTAPNSISADGRYVVWSSRAEGIVADDTNGKEDVFVYDTRRRTTTLVSHTRAGATSNGDSRFGRISSDGRFIVFLSNATDLPGADAAAADGDLFYRYDLATGRVVLLSIVNGVARRGVFFGFDVSATTRYIAFSTAAALAANDTDGEGDVYRFDTRTGAIRWVSAGSDGSSSDGFATIGGVSATGSVAYSSTATNIVPLAGQNPNLINVYLWNPRTGNRLVTRSPAGQGANDGSTTNIDISDDGSIVAFAGRAGNLVTEDGPAFEFNQEFIYRVRTGKVTRISRDFSGLPAGQYNYNGSVAPSGRYVVYQSYIDPSLGEDSYILRYDTRTGRTTLLVHSADVIPAGISSDGRRVLFQSDDAALAPGTDTNQTYDVYLFTQRGY